MKINFNVPQPRAPPNAIVDVELKLITDTTIRELMIIAPPAFMFPPDGCGDMCVPGAPYGSSGRWTARIISVTGAPLLDLAARMIKVITPQQTPLNKNWFVQAEDFDSIGAPKRIIGWGDAAGFDIYQMKNILPYPMIMYPGVSSLQNAQITFKFTLDLAGGNRISIVQPVGYILSCSNEGAMKQLSLPGTRPDCVDDPLELFLKDTMSTGEYSFGLDVDLPMQTPVDNTWSIIVKNQEDDVVDAAFRIEGQKLIDIAVDLPMLTWSAATPGQRTMITFGLTFTGQTIRVLAFLLSFPLHFHHDVRKPQDVTSLNPKLGLDPQEWADVTSRSRLKFRLDATNPDYSIAPGTYRFTFPAKMPCCVDADMPRNNVWYVSLCSDQLCFSPDDATVVLTFPISGFALNELAPDAATRMVGSARRQHSTCVTNFLAVLLVLFAPALAVGSTRV